MPRERELILGGQKSGKSRRAETAAAAWLAADPARDAVLIATAQPHDAEMRERIARHRADRAARVPGLRTVEEPRALPDAIAALSAPGTLVVVDCLTLWLTSLAMPLHGAPVDASDAAASLVAALHEARGPIVLVGNEIGLGVIPLGREVRAFVDALGQLNQAVAAVCDRVTLMAAGLPLTLKEPV
ncbi:bifunctional adenosylcobinamide kinase/adenosylcobinamide-phosphate guanylyltransferase [Variovorax sp. N23]|uniref:bifunctional adenosylcobinamide kinase/adenosylcobinamide-phosphate guanylyltransferase n=1 Tax=Variovorax sp. N23 TaxID=2980555 RepID=UPI0021CA36A8|nr:bifunctional adenosylcobinamide kinase/adenosylcobinamide-phosphate guanylyltransferase [Variovorax sp. N23]MCU4119223.1 bifunctional adenosylcobinamide kinase/adenosylcobinamide-phosphate guanylyltransferase [Variovorax sp. N23]